MERARQQEKGIPVGAVGHLAKMVHIPEAKVLKAIDYKPATYYRTRKKPGVRLPRDQTETVARLMKLFQMANDTLPDASAWFHSPSPHLEGVSPFEFARTEDGGRVVESLLRRIEYGSVA